MFSPLWYFYFYLPNVLLQLFYFYLFHFYYPHCYLLFFFQIKARATKEMEAGEGGGHVGIDSERWVKMEGKKDRPSKRHGHSVVFFGGNLYLFGGRNDSGPCPNTIFLYNIRMCILFIYVFIYLSYVCILIYLFYESFGLIIYCYGSILIIINFITCMLFNYSFLHREGWMECCEGERRTRERAIPKAFPFRRCVEELDVHIRRD